MLQFLSLNEYCFQYTLFYTPVRICLFIQVHIQERRMIDCFRIWAKGGDDGNGCTSIRHSRHDSRGRPDGMFSNHFIPQWR